MLQALQQQGQVPSPQVVPHQDIRAQGMQAREQVLQQRLLAALHAEHCAAVAPAQRGAVGRLDGLRESCDLAGELCWAAVWCEGLLGTAWVSLFHGLLMGGRAMTRQQTDERALAACRVTQQCRVLACARRSKVIGRMNCSMHWANGVPCSTTASEYLRRRHGARVGLELCDTAGMT